MENKMTDNEIIKALDILEMFDFFGGQRAGRELWIEKPVNVQDEDIKNFSEDIKFLKDFIDRQQVEVKRLEIELKAMRGAANSYKAEVERLQKLSDEGAECPTCHGVGKIGTTNWLTRDLSEKQIADEKARAVEGFHRELKVEAIKEFLERFTDRASLTYLDHFNYGWVITQEEIDNIKKEMTEDK